MKLVKGYPVDLTADEARVALTDVPFRVETWRTPWGEAPDLPEHPWTAVLIQYKGEWLLLGRTDLKDDVETGRDAKGMDAPVEYFRKCIRYGARIRDGRFCVIDAWSDG